MNVLTWLIDRPDLLIFLAALAGMLLNRYYGPHPTWSSHTVVEVVVAALSVLALYVIAPGEQLEQMTRQAPYRTGVFVILVGFFVGPGVITTAKTVLLDRLPSWAREAPPAIPKA